ncbi:MAG: hypothetical protein D3910_21290 [Candidatus Electrothrix sp. ATG2]|nr:hypothetical protein [Candidatus Electrothrix sp. ATG2]
MFDFFLSGSAIVKEGVSFCTTKQNTAFIMPCKYFPEYLLLFFLCFYQPDMIFFFYLCVIDPLIQGICTG